jgi:hypothetical protein
MRSEQSTEDRTFLRHGRKTEEDISILEEGDIPIWCWIVPYEY